MPNEYFFDFLRGSFDGDGSFYSYWDKRWKSSFLFYLSFVSASLRHLMWLRKSIARFLGVKGHIDFSGGVYQLKYAKREAEIILDRMYYSPRIPKLERKFKKVQTALNTNSNNP
jgi:intein-encoded DNA endonuclease-like protein